LLCFVNGGGEGQIVTVNVSVGAISNRPRALGERPYEVCTQKQLRQIDIAQRERHQIAITQQPTGASFVISTSLGSRVALVRRTNPASSVMLKWQ